MIKRLFGDLETTGTNAKLNGIIQIGGIIEIDGDVKEEFNLLVSPFESDGIESKALEVTGRTKEEIFTFEKPRVVYNKLLQIITKYISKYDKNDKFTFVGYNSEFDVSFLREWFTKLQDPYFGSLFWWPDIDVARLAMNKFEAERFTFSNFKLMTVAEKAGIKIEPEKAHDAMYDIQITRELFNKLKEVK